MDNVNQPRGAIAQDSSPTQPFRLRARLARPGTGWPAGYRAAGRREHGPARPGHGSGRARRPRVGPAPGIAARGGRRDTVRAAVRRRRAALAVHPGPQLAAGGGGATAAPAGRPAGVLRWTRRDRGRRAAGRRRRGAPAPSSAGSSAPSSSAATPAAAEPCSSARPAAGRRRRRHCAQARGRPSRRRPGPRRACRRAAPAAPARRDARPVHVPGQDRAAHASRSSGAWSSRPAAALVVRAADGTTVDLGPDEQHGRPAARRRPRTAAPCPPAQRVFVAGGSRGQRQATPG